MKIKIKNKTIENSFSDNISTYSSEELLKIDINNIFGDATTFPELLHELGSLKAEAEYAVESKKLSFDIWEAQVKIDLLNKVGKMTSEMIAATIRVMPEYEAKRKEINDIQLQLDYVTSLYKSATSKDLKLNKIVDIDLKKI